MSSGPNTHKKYYCLCSFFSSERKKESQPRFLPSTPEAPEYCLLTLETNLSSGGGQWSLRLTAFFLILISHTSEADQCVSVEQKIIISSHWLKDSIGE